MKPSNKVINLLIGILFFMMPLNVVFSQCYTYVRTNISNTIGAVLRDLGFSVRDTYTYGSLSEGYSDTFSRTFYYGVNYVLAVAGDDDAYDIDIYIYDSSNRLVAKHSDDDDVAIATFTARYTGTYYVKIVMYDAAYSTTPCWVLRYGYY